MMTDIQRNSNKKIDIVWWSFHCNKERLDLQTKSKPLLMREDLMNNLKNTEERNENKTIF